MRQENDRNERGWDFENYLRNYLLLLAKNGDSGLESIRNFPESVVLGKDLNEMLDNCRNETDKIERFGVIGAKRDGSALLVPVKFWKGVEGKVPNEIINEANMKAGEEGVEVILGDVHSHPRRPFRIGLESDKNRGHFSGRDFHTLITGQIYFCVLADNGKNLVAFKSRETVSRSMMARVMAPESFSGYWRAEGEAKDSRKSSEWMNKLICQAYGLALYRGDAGKRLDRV